MLIFRIFFTDTEEKSRVVRVFGESDRDAMIKKIGEKGFKITSISRLYPVASWEKHQHVFYNMMDRAANAYHDDHSSENYEKWEEAQRLAGVFDYNPQDGNGVVYAEYEDYKKLKDIIGGYAWRHNGVV